VNGAALLRFWWLLGLGIVVAIGAAAWMVYDLPDLTPRTKATYTANAQLFVTSPDGSYIRLSVPRAVETGGDTSSSAKSSKKQASTRESGGPLIVRDPPNVQPLLAAANLYPLLIESDQVSALRRKMFGPIPGTVQAQAVGAVSTPSRFVPSELPVIDIFASSSSAQRAEALAFATSRAFQRWIRLEQDRAGLERRERVLINVLRAPHGAVESGGPSFGIPVLVALAVLASFCLLALALDRIFAGAPKTRASESA